MPLKAKAVLFALSLVLFCFVLSLIVKRRMRIEHSLLWLAVSLILMALTVWQPIADRAAYFVGIDYPPSLFFAVAIIFAFLMLFYIFVEISTLKEQNQALNQELAISRHLIETLEEKLAVPQEKRAGR
jgi:hypothetical protein